MTLSSAGRKPVILVTGATGSVGSRLCREILDRNQAGLVAVGRMNSMISGCQHSIIKKNIGPETVWDDVLEGVSIVVHLAAIVHQMADAASVDEYRRVNVEGTRKLVCSAIAGGISRFVFVSTIKVLGESSSESSSLNEEWMPNPTDNYSRSKHEAERVVEELCRKGGVDFVIVRPALVYGPGDKGNFKSLCRLVMSGVPLPFASIKNSRSMVSVDNLCDLLLRACVHEAAKNEVFCAADRDDVSTAQLVVDIGRACGRNSRVFPFPVPILKMLAAVAGRGREIKRLTGSLKVDARKARRLLGWDPRPRAIELKRYLSSK